MKAYTSTTVTEISPLWRTGARANGTRISVAIAAVRESLRKTGSLGRRHSAVMARKGRERRGRADYRKFSSTRNAGTSDQRFAAMQVHPVAAAYCCCQAIRKRTTERIAQRTRGSLKGSRIPRMPTDSAARLSLHPGLAILLFCILFTVALV